jgi:hypothetical protein
MHLRDRQGKIWTISRVSKAEAEDEDMRFWRDGLTPEQRVEAVHLALESTLKARGINAVPRLRRDSRILPMRMRSAA